MTPRPWRPTRRAFLASSVAATLAAACSGGDDSAGPAPDTTTSSTQAPADTTPTPTPSAEPIPGTTPEPLEPVDLPGDPFTLGVASGDPTSTSVILWTRLAPTPLDGGGMPDENLDVTWEVALDVSFVGLVASGRTPAIPGLAHSVHVDATGLAADTWYFYRFRIGEWTSPVGRCRTLPAVGATVESLRFGFSSCQNYEHGFYAAHANLALEDLDLFVWLGDYIYEAAPGRDPIQIPGGAARSHTAGECFTLADYRNRYALYKTDPNLQASHAARPWIVTWDDHEVVNDYAGPFGPDGATGAVFDERRAAGYLAWYEHMPVRLDPPDGVGWDIHRTIDWGDLASLFMLDGRQYRDDQPTDGDRVSIPGFGDALPITTIGPTAMDPDHSMLGADQEAWLLDGLRAAGPRWKVLANQVMMHGATLPLGDEPVVVNDTWDGYFANRRRILETIAADGVDDVVVLTGDFHSATVGDVKPDPFDAASPVVATEFMASSITSRFPLGENVGLIAPLLTASNPQIRFFDARKGYCTCEVTPDSWTTTYRAIADATVPDQQAETLSTWRVVAGTPGAQPI
ncbi:MAG: alkaline phosphatase D family protein [Acidimicrobiales bacterium]